MAYGNQWRRRRGGRSPGSDPRRSARSRRAARSSRTRRRRPSRPAGVPRPPLRGRAPRRPVRTRPARHRQQDHRVHPAHGRERSSGLTLPATGNRFMESRRPDSNRRPHLYERCALPAELLRRVGPKDSRVEGLERAWTTKVAHMTPDVVLTRVRGRDSPRSSLGGHADPGRRDVPARLVGPGGAPAPAAGPGAAGASLPLGAHLRDALRARPRLARPGRARRGGRARACRRAACARDATRRP